MIAAEQTNVKMEPAAGASALTILSVPRGPLAMIFCYVGKSGPQLLQLARVCRAWRDCLRANHELRALVYAYLAAAPSVGLFKPRGAKAVFATPGSWTDSCGTGCRFCCLPVAMVHRCAENSGGEACVYCCGSVCVLPLWPLLCGAGAICFALSSCPCDCARHVAVRVSVYPEGTLPRDRALYPDTLLTLDERRACGNCGRVLRMVYRDRVSRRVDITDLLSVTELESMMPVRLAMEPDPQAAAAELDW